MIRPGQHILATTLLECCFLLICGAVMGGRLSKNFHHHHHQQQQSTKEPVIMCGNMKGLSMRQHEICTDQPHAVASAIQGMKVAVHECQFQFKKHKWNCSSLKTNSDIPHTSPFLSRGFRETAFSYAIAAAGVAHMVAHACHLGKIEGCDCQGKPKFEDDGLITAGQRKELIRNAKMVRGKKRFQREGCDFDIDYALGFSVEFLDRQASDQHAVIARHNNRAGRLIVANKMRQRCKCNGMSGSCSLETCWKETPSFRQVGADLKQLYKDAARIDISNSISPQRALDSYGVRVDQLVYFEDSPSYCQPDSRINFPGTKGRHCNRTAGPNEPDSCEKLCCGRHYETEPVTITEKCKCKFHWCCYVNCHTCQHTETVAVCR